MGGSSGQVTGYRYFTNLLLFIGNPIEKMLGINFDKRGWISPFVDENGNALAQGVINSPNLYGENEGGVAGTVHVQYGRDNQEVLPFYKAYMDSKELPASAFPYQSYLAFTGMGAVNNTGLIGGVIGTLMPQYNNAFYVGNSGYMKEMLLWPKRIHVRNDGRVQWYDDKAEIGRVRFLPPDGLDISGLNIVAKIDTHRVVDNVSYEKIDELLAGQEMEGGIRWDDSAKRLNPNFVKKTTGSRFIYGWIEGGLSSVKQIAKIQGNKKIYVIANIRVVQIAEKASVKINGNTDAYVKNSTNYIDGSARIVTEMQVIFRVDEGLEVQSEVDGIYKQDLDYLTESTIEISLVQIPNSEQILYEFLDINPIHKIREILTDDTAMSKPESSVNDINFMKAADRIWDEGLGVSWSITEKSCIDAINELCYHIEAGIRVNRQTGLYEMVLFRDDWFEEDEIHTISESKIKKGSMQYEITNADEVINQVNVNYYDRANIKNSSFSISESGLIQTLGRVNAETLDFPYFMNMRNAEIVANWKLKQLSTGAFKGSFTTGWREARKWNRYDLIRLPWSKRWTGTILVRIMSINLGGPTNNEVSIEFIEVVPATGMMNTTIVIDDPIDTKPEAPQPCNAKVFELPYFEAVQAFGEREVGIELADNPEAGYLCAISEKPQNNSLNAALYVDGSNGFERVATINYCETAYLDQNIDRISITFMVKNAGNIASVRTGSQIFINDEIMVYQSYDAETKVLTVKRGAFDSTPQNHNANSILYFADDFVAVDKTLYVDGEAIEAKVLTTTPSGVLALSDATTLEVEMKARAIRPYPPANVKINGAYFPETQIVTNNIVLTWVHRNRMQQTGGQIVGWYEGDVTVEDGVNYSYELTSNNTVLASASNITSNTATINSNILIPNKPHTLKLWSVRDGYDSYQTFEHSFFVESASLILTVTATKSNVVGNTIPIANISVNVDESLKANMRFDGSSISGKAQAGATITIEVDE